VPNLLPIGKGGGGEANLYTLTVSHGKTDRVVVKTPLGGHIDSVKHEARIAHRLRDGMVWAAMREPWEPLQDINGSQYNRIADEVRIMRAGGGYDNIHQFLAFVSPATLPPLGGLISTRAEGNITVSAALYGSPLGSSLDTLMLRPYAGTRAEWILYGRRKMEGSHSSRFSLASALEPHFRAMLQKH
jgi:hypothetical protein